MGKREWIAMTLLCMAATELPAAITIRNDVPLAFGSLIASNAAGTITITPAGSRNASVVVPFGATGFSAASFTVTIPAGNPHFTIILPASTTLAGSGGGSMTVDSFQSQPGGGGNVDAHSNSATLTVGATLRVGPNQPAGTYSGTFLVMVTNP